MATSELVAGIAIQNAPKKIVMGLDFSYMAHTCTRNRNDVALAEMLLVIAAMIQNASQCTITASRGEYTS